MKNNVLAWFEIPVLDMERAIEFYTKVFGYELTRMQNVGCDLAMFPSTQNGYGAAGALVMHPEYYRPAKDGSLIYFGCADLNVQLARVDGAGGKVVVPKTLIKEEIGNMGIFIDSEGNRIGLFSM